MKKSSQEGNADHPTAKEEVKKADAPESKEKNDAVIANPIPLPKPTYTPVAYEWASQGLNTTLQQRGFGMDRQMGYSTTPSPQPLYLLPSKPVNDGIILPSTFWMQQLASAPPSKPLSQIGASLRQNNINFADKQPSIISGPSPIISPQCCEYKKDGACEDAVFDAKVKDLPYTLIKKLAPHDHLHIHCEFCGHARVKHNGHIDFAHDGELHFIDGAGKRYLTCF